jgi:hypothetical protein
MTPASKEEEPMRRYLSLLVLALVAGCGSDKSGTPAPQVPAAATEMQTFARSSASLMVKGLGSFDALLPFVSNLGSPGAAGFQFTPDVTPGAPPNTYQFSIPFDSDGDGSLETNVSGRAVLTGDPASAAVGFGGSIELVIDSEGGLGDFGGSIDFLLTADGTRMSGAGTCTDAVGGNTTALVVDAAHPLLVKPATGASDAVANACGYSLDGAVSVEVTGPGGFLGGVWNFLSSRPSAHVTGATYHDEQGQVTSLPSADVTLACGGSIQDWAGTYLQDYSCIPPEYGIARLTITQTGSNRIHIVDEDPPDSHDTNTYDATMLPGDPHVVRGFFIGGPDGSTYRETFTWTLTENAASFSQVSVYQYLEGPDQGGGGICAARATRER